jgi:hypothetical protein
MTKQENNLDIDNKASNQGAQGVFNAPVNNSTTNQTNNSTNEGILTKTNAFTGIIVGLLIIITILGLKSATNTSTTNKPADPKDILLQFIEAVNNGDISTINSMSSREVNSGFSPNVTGDSKTSTCPDPAITNSKVSGATARITVTCHGYALGTYILIQEDGQWKVHDLRR